MKYLPEGKNQSVKQTKTLYQVPVLPGRKLGTLNYFAQGIPDHPHPITSFPGVVPEPTHQVEEEERPGAVIVLSPGRVWTR